MSIYDDSEEPTLFDIIPDGTPFTDDIEWAWPTAPALIDWEGYIARLVDGLTPVQRRIWDDHSRFKMPCMGRRAGKTFLCCVRLAAWAAQTPGGLFWYVTKTYRSAKRIAWKQLKELIPIDLLAKSPNESELFVELRNGAVIQLMGSDDLDSLRGVGLHGAIIDEAAFCKEELWTEILRPSLATYSSPCWFPTTPRGFNWYYDLFQTADSLNGWSTWSYTTAEGGLVPLEEIELAKATTDVRTFRQEYEASFEALSGRVFPDFDDENIDDTVEDIGGPIYVGLDFNVGIMAGVLCSLVEDELHQWDEIALTESNTDEVCLYLKERFPGRDIWVYPDPTGRARKTSSAGVTDHGIIRSYGFKCIAPDSPWSVKDRINATNALILAASGRIRYYVHPRSVHTIKGARGVVYKADADGYLIDKSAGLEHWMDGLGYLILSAANRVQPYPVGQVDAPANG